jgi:hypothetical protein
MNKDDENNNDEEQEQEGWVSRNVFVVWVLF